MTLDPIIEAGFATHSFVQEQLNNLTPHARLSTLKVHPHNHRLTGGSNISQCFLQTSEKPIVLHHNDNDDKENTPPPRALKEVTCEECGKIYRGKNARSILRRHLKDKHKIEQPRATRWDNDPNRPKTDEERRQRMLESKRKSAQKARAKKNLMKEMAQQENIPITDVSITQNLRHRLKQWSIPSTPSSTSPKFVHTTNSPNHGVTPYSTVSSSKAPSPFFSSPRNNVTDAKPFNHHLCSSPIHYHYNNTQFGERKTNNETNTQNY